MLNKYHKTCLLKLKNAYKIVTGQSEGKMPLTRHRLGLEENITNLSKKTEWTGVWSVGLL
jgi:hypothetical protein